MEAMTRVAVEVLDSHDRVHTRERLVMDGGKKSFTVGRGAAADVMIDDAHSAPLHAAVELGADGRWRVTDLGTVNGVIVGGRRHHGAVDLVLPDGRLQVGHTRLHVRGEHEALAPEREDRGNAGALTGHMATIAIAGALVCAGFTAYFGWLVASRDTAMLIAASLLSLFIGTAVWIAIWALLTRVMRGEGRWVTHAAIALGAGAVLLAVEWVMALAWFAFGLPTFPARNVLLSSVVVAAALFWHVTTAARITRRSALWFAVIGPNLIVGMTNWGEARKHTRDVNFIGERMQLFPPALRLRQSGTLDAFFDNAASLKQGADRKRKAMASDDASDATDAEDEDE